MDKNNLWYYPNNSLTIPQQNIILHMWCSSMNLNRLFVTMTIHHAVKIFGAKKLSSYIHLLQNF